MRYEIYVNGKCIKSSDRVIPIFDFLLRYSNTRLDSVNFLMEENGDYRIFIETR